jgi:hypothetical protein
MQNSLKPEIVKLNDGRGPVCVQFEALVGLNIHHLGFSQRRKKGFRNFIELDHRRVLAADLYTINVFGYSHDFKCETAEDQLVKSDDCDPTLIISYDINSKSASGLDSSKDSTLVLDLSEKDDSEETILFTQFLSDYDPSFILLASYSPKKKCSYLKFIKIFNQIE